MNPFPAPLPRIHRLTYLAAALLGFAAINAVQLQNSNGMIVFPLDDSYIHLQFAYQLANGHFFQYVNGEGYCKGATSFLYPLLLVPLHWFVPRGELLVFLVIGLGVLWLWLIAGFLDDLATHATGSRAAGLCAGLLACFSGHLTYSCFSGMEIGLVCTTMLWLLWSIERNSSTQAIVAGCLLALSRPEGALLAMIACAMPWVVHTLDSACPDGRPPWALLVLPILAGLVQPACHWLYTGNMRANTLFSLGAVSADPSVPVNLVGWGRRLSDGLAELYAETISRHFLGYFAPAGLLLALLGLFVTAQQPRAGLARGFGATLLLWVFAVAPVAKVLVPHTYHMARYQMPFLPLFLLGLVAGIWALDHWTHHQIRPGWVMPVLLPLSMAWWGSCLMAYGTHCSDIARQHAVATGKLEARPHLTAPVAINDAGYLAYTTQLPVFDLVGLVTNSVAPYSLPDARSEHLFEYLENRKAQGLTLPGYFAGYTAWFGPLNDLGVFVYEDQVVLLAPAVAGDPVLTLARTDWSLLGSGHTCPKEEPGWGVVDRLDVADFDSERLHRYRLYPAPPHLPVQRQLLARAEPDGKTSADAGRVVVGEETFTLHGLPGRPARLVLRTLWQPGGARQTEINGALGERWVPVRGERASEWNYLVLDLPAQGGNASFHVRILSEPGALPCPVFHYWLLAPQP